MQVQVRVYVCIHVQVKVRVRVRVRVRVLYLPYHTCTDAHLFDRSQYEIRGTRHFLPERRVFCGQNADLERLLFSLFRQRPSPQQSGHCCACTHNAIIRRQPQARNKRDGVLTSRCLARSSCMGPSSASSSF